ncbi:MAG: hypothetical protein MJ211_12335, partial [Bacteroidales bacterium]|nr:hypothetical protein [Bacteroidales bacterium]
MKISFYILFLLLVINKNAFSQEINGYFLQIIDCNNNILMSKKFKKHKIDSSEINLLLIKTIENKIDNGYPFASLISDSIVIKNKIINFYYSLKDGNFYKIDNIYFPNKPKISNNYIFHTIDIYPKSSFSHKLYSKIDDKINNCEFISTLKPSEIEFHSNDADIYMYLQKIPSNMIEGILTILYDEKYYLAGNCAINLINNLGQGEKFNFIWKGYKNKSQELSTYFSMPYIFNSPTNISTAININKSDTTSMNFIITPNIGYKINHNLLINTNIKYSL